MSRIITINTEVFKFSELSEDAQDNAVTNLWDINVDFADWHDFLQDDLKEQLKTIGIGYEHVYFNAERGRYWYAYLDKAYVEDTRAFLKAAGADLRTKEAREVLENGIGLNNTHYGGGQAKTCVDSDYFEDELQEVLNDYLEEFLNNVDKDYDYLTSRPAIVETIEANEYDFTDDGKLF